MSVWAKKWAYEQHPKRLDDNRKLTNKKHPAAKAVLVALAEFPGPGQRHCWPAQKTLADMTDFTERQIRSCLADLEDQGFIARTPRYRKDGGRRSDTITLLGAVEAFGPPQDVDDPQEESSAPPREHSSGHEPSVNEPDKELANARSSGKPQKRESVQPVEQYHTSEIYNEMKQRGYRWTGDEYGYHLGRVKDMLTKDKPTNEELDDLPSFFADYYEDWNPKADAVSALREMRRSRRREEKPTQRQGQHEAPHPHSDAAQTARERPRALTWYLACYNEEEAVLREWIGDGLSHSEIVARLEGRAA